MQDPRRLPPVHIQRRGLLASLIALPFAPACTLLPPIEADPLATNPQIDDLNASAWGQACRLPPSAGGWMHRTFAQRKAMHYQAIDQWMGRPALQARGLGANSLVRAPVQPPAHVPDRCQFAWFAHVLNPATAMADPQRNDVCLRWTFTFGGDRSSFTARDRTLSELAQLLTGEPLPHATLMYVWDPALPEGTIVHHPNSSRIRHLVIQSGDAGLGRWTDHERNLKQDFERVFGEEAGPLEGIAAFSNSNNTGHDVQVWYGPMVLT
jgi:hypothetical protein